MVYGALAEPVALPRGAVSGCPADGSVERLAYSPVADRADTRRSMPLWMVSQKAVLLAHPVFL